MTGRWIVAIVLMLAAGAAHAAAGQVLFALGRVEIQRGGQVLVAQRGTAVEVGDTISTGPTGLTQVRLKDGALLSLRYGSSMKVEEFKLPAAAAAAAPTAGAAPAVAATAPSTGGGRSVLRLLRGAFRTVTGLIGKNTGDSYSLVTPVATIGIRGTDYSAAYCNGDCGSTPDGLYVGVSSGEIELNNDAGQLVLTNDQYGYVKDNSTAPDQELAPPEVLETPIEGQEGDDSDSDDGGAAGPVGDETPPESSFGEESGTAGAKVMESAQPEGDYELLPGVAGSYAYAAPGFKGARDNGVYTDDNGNLTGFLTSVFTSIGTAQNTDTGADAASGLRWGRWSGGVASAGGDPLDLNGQSLHWVYALSADAPQLPTSGTASYTLVGFTKPTDLAGNVGTVGDAQFSADFVNGTVTSSLNLIVNNQTWNADGIGSIGGSLFAGSYTFDAVSCPSCGVTVNDAGGAPIAGTGAGAFTGFFTNNAAGAGLAYHLGYAYSAGGSDEVTGAAAFVKQTGGVAAQ